jgi:hypothetical protein
VSEQDLQSMKTGEVAEKALQAGVEGVEDMNKSEMIEAMGGGGDESSQPGHGGGQGDTPPREGSDPSEWKNQPGNQS